MNMNSALKQHPEHAKALARMVGSNSAISTNPTPLPDMCSDTSSTNSTNPTGLSASEMADYPRDSIIEPYLEFAREFSELSDDLIVGAILPVCAAILGRSVWIDFAGPKRPNLYTLIVTPPGNRKSTTIGLAEAIAKRVMPDESFNPSSASPEGLFDLYNTNPDRLLIEDEGNTIITNWERSQPGILVSKTYLKLYDCKDLSEGYRGNKKADKPGSIPETSTSILMGTTPLSARFSRLETSDGMRRRFGYYVADGGVRTIIMPRGLSSDDLDSLASLFEPLAGLQGRVQLADASMPTWCAIQEQNRRDITELASGFDKESEVLSSVLSESPSRILKLAMIFECCRWAQNRSRNWREIQPDTLEIAARHVRYNVAASKSLDHMAHRGETRELANVIHAKILNMKGSPILDQEGWHLLNKSQITSVICPNPGRAGSITTNELYDRVIPDLMQTGKARLHEKKGKLEVYAFNPAA